MNLQSKKLENIPMFLALIQTHYPDEKWPAMLNPILRSVDAFLQYLIHSLLHDNQQNLHDHRVHATVTQEQSPARKAVEINKTLFF